MHKNQVHRVLQQAGDQRGGYTTGHVKLHARVPDLVVRNGGGHQIGGDRFRAAHPHGATHLAAQMLNVRDGCALVGHGPARHGHHHFTRRCQPHATGQPLEQRCTQAVFNFVDFAV